ncbi:efflux RND transporter periplasmic adaptor subunit [Bythopirellula polymerisocia]|uniref:Cobalt-zinc-cadmium resistance protein CzcB n=1 Tax=Bythopirellula polymerisocia TaxID=2528003 RepID=A0A5C6D395_9BACT|nr:efflux RND transporter periplasmic adaptor subunit [Bythopirellula polymerisocia]TWU29329.1 Cobalt-zinc-cadmium resistance protein CzcB [Bythopirellula polymerisocia]
MNRTKLLSGLVVLSAVLITAWLLRQFWPVLAESEPPEELLPAETIPIVRLSQEKQVAAGIRAQAVRRENLPLLRTLPARFAYDETRHVAVRAATDGVLEEVLVKPGDIVTTGQTIAVLRSPAVGAARSEVLTRTAEHQLAKTARDRHLRIYHGVENLAASIEKGEPIESIEEQLSEATLGSYGGKLLTKYSKAILATRLAQSASSVRDSGALSGRVHHERQSELQQARAEIEAALDQSLFETHQAYKQAEAAEQAAERSLIVARQQLVTLLGTNQRLELTPVANSKETDLARLAVRSPISGTVERKIYSKTERVSAGSELFTVADTSQLWVIADVRNRDWSAIQVQAGDPVTVTTPATEDERLSATIYFVGREVDPASGAIPIVATIYNNSGKYRPGLFARVEVPIGNIPDSLVVHDSAVIDLGGEQSVFVEENGGYRPIKVEIGSRSGDLVEILAGLTEGQQVVVAGAFVLKSELLLEGEE